MGYLIPIIVLWLLQGFILFIQFLVNTKKETNFISAH